MKPLKVHYLVKNNMTLCGRTMVNRTVTLHRKNVTCKECESIIRKKYGV